jgi:hypothetical protein
MKFRTTIIDAAPSPWDCYKDLVLEALRAKGMWPSSHRPSEFLEHFSIETLERFTLENEGSGWSFFLTFKTTEPEMPNTMAMPPQLRVDDPMTAFLLGAETICKIATGSSELPFKAVGNRVFFATVGPENLALA